MTQFSLSQSTAAGILTRLEKNGLLVRQADETDARKSIITLTTSGLAMESNLKLIAAQTEDLLLHGMTEEERAEFNHLLQIALSNMNVFRAVSSKRGIRHIEEEHT